MFIRTVCHPVSHPSSLWLLVPPTVPVQHKLFIFHPPTSPLSNFASLFNPSFQNVYLPLLSSLVHYLLRWCIFPAMLNSDVAKPSHIPLPNLLFPTLTLSFHHFRLFLQTPLAETLCWWQRLESVSHTRKHCWPWWLGLVAAMINAPTRQEACASACQDDVYILPKLPPPPPHLRRVVCKRFVLLIDKS